MKKYLTTFPLATGKKKRLITTYRSNQDGEFMRNKHLKALTTLEQNYTINTDYSFAYLKEQSIKKLVYKHIDNRYFYQFDITNFFGSIDHQILLDKLVSSDDNFNQSLISECSNGKPMGLALGLIPSPYLSNIYLGEFDEKLVTALKKLDSSIIYTRYSDDLTISCQNELELSELEKLLNKLLEDVKLQLNDSKTRCTEVTKKGQHIKVLGLNIIHGEEQNYITVGRKFKRNTKYQCDPQKKHAMDSYINYNEM